MDRDRDRICRGMTGVNLKSSHRARSGQCGSPRVELLGVVGAVGRLLDGTGEVLLSAPAVVWGPATQAARDHLNPTGRPSPHLSSSTAPAPLSETHNRLPETHQSYWKRTKGRK